MMTNLHTQVSGDQAVASTLKMIVYVLAIAQSKQAVGMMHLCCWLLLS